VGYRYCDPGNVASDISWLPLGNCSGRLVAVEAPAGLPIITSMRAPCSGPSVVGGVRDLEIDYVGEAGERAAWNPWKICFEDGMQPAVGIIADGRVKVFWPLEMRPVSRRWIGHSNILETVNAAGEFELTTIDFMPIDEPLLLRRFVLKNISGAVLSMRLYHYCPLNPSGRYLRTYSRKRDYRHIESDNRCKADGERGRLIFSCENPRGASWLVGSTRAPSGVMCGEFPQVYEAVRSGAVSAAVESAGVVDGALYFDFPEVAPGAGETVDILTACRRGETVEEAEARFAQLLGEFDADRALERTRQFWSGWAGESAVPGGKRGAVEETVRRLLSVIKACTWDIGGMPCDQGELTDFYFRDSLRPAAALSLFGHHDEAEGVLLALQAYASKYGYNNCNDYEEWVGEAVRAGCEGVSGFKDTKEFSVDDPALVVYTAGRMWQTSGRDEFVRRIWPLVEYSVNLGLRDMAPIGAIAQNAGFQDDMMNWAFPRGEDPYGSAPGLTCSYWNMVWARALELASQMAGHLGKADLAREWREEAAGIRRVVDTEFWNEDLGRYAYFHDPVERAAYFEDTRFTAVGDGRAGQFVFPQPPIANGATMLHWCGYTTGERAERTYESVRERLFPLPDELVVNGPFDSTLCYTSHRYHGADQSISYARLLYAACEVGDVEAADALAEWLVRHTPLAGVPEVLPTGVRAVQLWPCGEVLIALHRYMTGAEGR